MISGMGKSLLDNAIKLDEKCNKGHRCCCGAVLSRRAPTGDRSGKNKLLTYPYYRVWAGIDEWRAFTFLFMNFCMDGPCFLQWALNHPDSHFTPSPAPTSPWIPAQWQMLATGWDGKRKMMSAFHDIDNKKGVIWCLLLSCIKTAVPKCSPIKHHSCSLRVYNRVGWAVSQ